MLLIQLTGLSGSGKSTIANLVKKMLVVKNYRVEVIDGDIYRKRLWPDLGFSKKDRNENISRLGFIANLLATNGVISILAAINPYEDTRREISALGPHVKTAWIKCDMNILLNRDTKNLYKRAFLPEGHPEKINNLTGINDPYEIPVNPDLVIDTGDESEEQSADNLFKFIMSALAG